MATQHPTAWTRGNRECGSRSTPNKKTPPKIPCVAQAFKERLLECIKNKGLPERTRRAAQFVLMRLDKRPKDAKRQPVQVLSPRMVMFIVGEGLRPPVENPDR